MQRILGPDSAGAAAHDRAFDAARPAHSHAGSVADAGAQFDARNLAYTYTVTGTDRVANLDSLAKPNTVADSAAVTHNRLS